MKNKKLNQLVYLFRHKGTDFVKIGMTSKDDCSHRFTAFCTYSPYGGEIVGIIKTNDALSLEKKLHNDYSNKRMNGEFFLLSQQECDFILEKNKIIGYDEVLNLLKIIESKNDFKIMNNIKNFCLLQLRSLEGIESKFKYEDDLGNKLIISEGAKNTSTYISDKLKDIYNLDIAPVVLGKYLSSNFKKSRVRLKGSVCTVYNCDVINIDKI